MDCHSTSETVQTQGSLALGNIIRTGESISSVSTGNKLCFIATYPNLTDPSQCSELVFMGALHTLSVAMESFLSSVHLQVSAMAALAVLLSTHKDRRLLFMSEHGRILDLVLMVMDNFPNNAQLQQYACSFFALLTAEGTVSDNSVCL